MGRREFSVRESNMVKGIAIILMLYHHLFNDLEEYTGYVINFAPFTQERVTFFALLAKICVAIFVFITGYGTAYSYMNKKTSTHEFITIRYFKLMKVYWFVFVIALLCQPLGRTIFDAYGTNPKEMLLYFLFDVCGFSYLFGTGTLNPTWWYMSLAIIFICVTPAIIEAMDRYNDIAVAGLIVLSANFWKTGGINAFYLFPLVLGILAKRRAWVEKIDEKISDNMVRRILFIIFEFVVLLFLMSYRTEYNYIGMIDGAISFMLVLIVHHFIALIPLVNTVLYQLGKYSIYIFLFHTLLYSYYFLGFYFSMKYWWLCVIVLVVTSYLAAVVMDYLFRLLMKKFSALNS